MTLLVDFEESRLSTTSFGKVHSHGAMRETSVRVKRSITRINLKMIFKGTGLIFGKS